MKAALRFFADRSAQFAPWPTLGLLVVGLTAGCDGGEAADVDAGRGDAGFFPRADGGFVAVDGGVADAGVDAGFVDGGVNVVDGGSDGGVDVVDGGVDGGVDEGVPDAGPLPRGLAWVRSNPMFVSALTVDMGPPPAEFVRAYHDDFHANAAHLWATSMPAEVAGWAQHGPADFRYVAWLNPDGTSAADPAAGVLGGPGGPTRGRIGYQIGDEPGLFCDADNACAVADLGRMQVGVQAVRARDPDALLFLNFADLDTTPALLDAYADFDVDVVSYDAYHRGNKAYEILELVRAAGLAQERPYWRYLRSFGFDSGSEGVTASDARWDAYAGVLYGFTGHSWFLYTINASAELEPFFFTHENDFNAPRTALFAEVADVNLALRRLGPVLTQLTSTDVRYIPSNNLLQPAGTRRWSAGAGGVAALTDVAGAGNGIDLSLGFFRDPFGDVVFMVQNVSHSHGTFPTGHERSATVTLTFDFASTPGVGTDALRGFDLNTGASTTIALRDLGGTRRELSLSIAAGDLAIFKFDTGRDFVRGPQ